MLLFSILITTLLALGDVRAITYKDIENIAFLAEGNSNPYFTIRTESSDDGPVYWLDVLQDITSKLKLQLCEKWEYDTRGFGGDTCGSGGGGGNGEPVPPHNGTIHGPICRDLCCALDDLANTNPDIPGSDSMLGLHNQHCALKKGSSFQIPPRLSMPKVIDVDFEMVRDYIDYEAIIRPGEHCSSKNADPFVITTLVFFPCVIKKH